MRKRPRRKIRSEASGSGNSRPATLLDYLQNFQEEPCVVYPSGLRFCPVQLPPREARRFRPTGVFPEAPLIQPDPNAPLSRRFIAGLFLARHPEPLPYVRVKPELVAVLEAIADQVPGHGLQILSAYRTRAMNRERGDYRDSPHQDGLAADIGCQDLPLSYLYDAACELVGKRGAVYLYENRFVHLDVAGVEARRVVPMCRYRRLLGEGSGSEPCSGE